MESLKPQCGRPRKLSERDIWVLCRVVSSNRRHTLVELANLVSVSRTTVRFYLRELGFRNCIAPKKPYLNVKHKADRLAFARAYESWTFEDWCNIIWTDESSFETGKKSRQIRMWWKAYEKYNWDCITPSFKSGHSSVSVSRTTVRFYLRELGFRNCIAPKKPYLNVKHKADRLAFARAYESWTFEDWCNIIWTDESSFKTGKKSRQIRMWWKAYEKYNWDCITPSFKSGHSSVMVWGAFTSFDKSPLVTIPLDKRSSSDFVTIVYEGVLSGFYFLHDDPEQLILMEDGALVHRSSWRRAHGIEKLFWPANSPDLNPIENVWMVVKDLFKHHSRPNSKLEMIEKIQSVWDTISIEWLRTLISTMLYRMQAVIAAGGGSTRW